MKIKNLLITGITALTLFLGTVLTVDAKVIEDNTECKYEDKNYCNNLLTDGLESNQTTLFYMYGNEQGHYFLDPLAKYENVIFVSNDDFMFTKDKLHHGKRFIGTFEDNTMWELIDLELMVVE